MKSAIILSLCALLFNYNNMREDAERKNKLWNEVGNTPFSDITAGIPVYNKALIKYQRSGEKILKVELGEPVVVGVAEKEEKWGHFQFPAIYKDLKDNLIAQWHMSDDAISSYGQSNYSCMISVDNGKSWNPIPPESIVGGGLELPNGERIKVYTPAALKSETLKLPLPVQATHLTKGYTFYKVNDLPEELQGVYINRLKKGATQWTTEHSTLNDPIMVRYERGGLFPVVWWGDLHTISGSNIYTGVYPAFSLNKEGKVDPSGVDFYKSSDAGHTWELVSRITYVPDLKADPNGDKRFAFGYTEPAFEVLSDGSFLCVIRTSDELGISPMYWCRSNDEGKTWTKPKAFTSNGVLPRLLQLENGVVVLASGRPGVQLRFCTDGKGEIWTDPFQMLPYSEKKETVSCGYPEIIAIGRDRFLLIYSDFKYPVESGELRKAIKVREVKVTPIKNSR